MKKMPKKYLILLLSLFILPTIVYAKTEAESIDLTMAVILEVFLSLHWGAFVFLPISQASSKENSKKIFLILFFARVLILIYCDFYVTTAIAVYDFILLFFGAFIVAPIYSSLKRPQISEININSFITGQTPEQNQIQDIGLKCIKCNSELKVSNQFCPECGEPVGIKDSASKEVVLPKDFNEIYSLPEDKMLEEFIYRELEKAGMNKSSNLIPNDVFKKKINIFAILALLIFIFITLIFFHFPVYTYIIGIIILIISFKSATSYNLIKYLKKQVKARPDEKISNIIMTAKNTLVEDKSKIFLIVSLVIVIILPLIIFYNPRILFEKTVGGYAVRYYTFGLTNFKTATIPETYKNEKVVILRGNTFSNMFFLESVNLPDSLIEIRGQAFKNCYKLSEVNIPKTLEYLGGGAFYNAKSIKSIELPDTLTYMGGETFYGAKSLEYVKLSDNLSEIRGDSFEYCTSLKKITIPDNVTRIGGHAFYGDSSLEEVLISENSKLREIGSSAFRQCYSLREIIIPDDTYVNERAFKESPTTVRRYGDTYDNYYYQNYNY